MFRTPVPILLVLIFAWGIARSQAQLSDTTFVAEAQKNAIKLYTARAGPVSNVYNGSEHNEYRPQENEHPYLTEDWIYGTVNYGGEMYESVSLLYDIWHDELITMHASGNAIQMIHRKVRSFQLGSRTFVSINNEQVAEGFYERLHDGKVKFFVRRQKAFRQEISGYVITNIFDVSNHYYVVKDGKFNSFKSKGSLLNILKDRKSELKRFMRKEGIRFGSNREMDALRVLRYYDEIV